ncbi:hypothetical protein RHMOL_Rhmol01G0311100 [Rhododendron molle]|uniref:Uncharacterized protein n=1 Tax=Rhododendron molle TaxID=49168 RepID=A0ACC0Q749_RHOML|nr:hypothetical protein RHMOL_Rhmol01G0311100 [Rhododendron molle]
MYVGQEDPSQVFLLAGVWLLFLGFGSSACLIPVIYSIGHAYQDAFSSGYYYSSQPSQFLAILNGMFFMALGSVIGYPIASASVKALEGLWRNDLVALKGACPNCGEEVVQSQISLFLPKFSKLITLELVLLFGIDFPVMSRMDQLSMHYPQSFKPLQVFGFARSNQSNYSPHRADCHVCECSLEFRTKVEQSISIPGRRLVYGRIYLIKQRGRNHCQRWK